MVQTLDLQDAGHTYERRLFEELPIFGARLDLDGKIIECNFPTLGGRNTRFQRKPEFLNGRSLSSLHYWSFDPVSIERINGWISRCAGGESIVQDLRYRRISGESGTLEFSVKPAFSELNKIRSLICTCIDITELRRTQARLRSTEKRFQEMSHGLPHMVWMDNTLGLRIFVNRAYCEFFSIDEDQASEHNWRDRVHPDDVVYTRLYEKAVSERKPFRRQVRFRHANDQWYILEAIAKPNYTRTGEYVGFIGTSIDVTERCKVEARLAQADKRKDDFLATLAHELRNPLAPILSSVELIKQSDLQDKKIISMVEIIERQSVQMAQLIDDLMDASRISQGKIELHRSEECLADLIRNAVETARPYIARGMHTCAIQLPPGPTLINADGLRISQVITNLLNNAAKFTPAGGKITISLTMTNDGVNICVSDTGRGFAPEDIDRVFDMYSQFDKSPANGDVGLGVGLALSRDLINRHGGTLTVESDGLGRGSEFKIWLPASMRVSIEAQSKPVTSDSARQTSETVSDLKSDRAQAKGDSSPTVLVVDDNQDAGFILSQLLEHLGADAVLVHDGNSALETAERIKPDLIFLDIGLPDISGHEVARRIRGMGWAKGSKLVAISGLGTEQDVSRSLSAGFDLHKVKPVSLVHLQPLVDELLAK
jgi:PAS domain S-box-containing protein